MAVYCTYYQPVRFEILGVDGGWEYGRFVPDGEALTGVDAMLAGPYLPCRNPNSRTAWHFGGGEGYTDFAARMVIPARMAGGEGVLGPYEDYLFVHGSSWFTRGIYQATTVGSMWPEYPNAADSNPWSGTGGMYVTGEHHRYYVREEGADTTNRRFWRRQYPSGEVWSSYHWIGSSGGPPFADSELDLLMILEIGADPFKGGDGPGGTFDPSGIINAILNQSTMQEGYFSSWSSIFANLDANLSGELFGQNWEVRDSVRNNYLAQISGVLGTLPSGQGASTMRADLASVKTTVSSILAALKPTQIPPQVVSPGEEVTTPVLAIEDLEQHLTEPTTIIPEAWPMPQAPPDTASGVYTFELPLGTISGMPWPNQEFTMDVTPYDDAIDLCKTILVLFFGISTVFAVLEETRKH